jgi:hypothetical protein
MNQGRLCPPCIVILMRYEVSQKNLSAIPLFTINYSLIQLIHIKNQVLNPLGSVC